MSVTSFITNQINRTLSFSFREKLRYLIVPAVIIASFWFGYTARPNQKELILIGFVGLGATLIFLRRPVMGIISILVTGIYVAYLGPGGVNVTVVLVMVLPMLWIIELVAIRSEITIASSRVMVPIYVLMIVSTLAFGMGQFPWFIYVDSAPFDAQAGGYAIYFLSFVAFFVTANQIRTPGDLKKLVWAFIFFGGLYVVAAAIPGLRTPASALFGTSGSLFWLWFVALAYGMALFNNDLSLRWRAVLLALVGVAVYILFVLKFDNKSGWVPAFLILWVITYLRSWKLGGAMLLGGLVAGIYLYGEIYGTEGYSLSTRLELLPIMWQIFSANPMFGVGFGNYHFYAQLFAIRGWYVPLNSHNNYVDIFIQTGVVGALAFVWFVWEMVILMLRLRKQLQDGFSKGYLNAAIGGFAGMLVVGLLGDWFLPFVYNIGLNGFRASVVGWVLLGGVVALAEFPQPAES